MSDTRQRILDDIKTAMKAGDKTRLGTLRLVSAAIKQKEVDERQTIDESGMIGILTKLVKQRRESIAQYGKAGRDDLVAVEEAEIAVIDDYLPAGLEQSAIDAIVERAVNDTGAVSVKDMGAVMAAVKPALQGRADMAAVSRQIRTRLGA